MADKLEVKYFIMKPTSRDKLHAEASIAGLRAYAQVIKRELPNMAAEIEAWLDRSIAGDGSVGDG